jgi:hypothetical protein
VSLVLLLRAPLESSRALVAEKSLRSVESNGAADARRDYAHQLDLLADFVLVGRSVSWFCDLRGIAVLVRVMRMRLDSRVVYKWGLAVEFLALLVWWVSRCGLGIGRLPGVSWLVWA